MISRNTTQLPFGAVHPVASDASTDSKPAVAARMIIFVTTAADASGVRQTRAFREEFDWTTATDGRVASASFCEAMDSRVGQHFARQPDAITYSHARDEAGCTAQSCMNLP